MAWKNSLAIIVVLMLAGCTKGPTGPTGPTGPIGPPGPGSQTVYHYAVPDPLYAQGSQEMSCPAIKTDASTETMSTVTCYITRPGWGIYYVLPVSFFDTNSGTTYYTFSMATGKVIVYWSNSASEVPGPFVIWITVVNQ